jgi:excisionase family DNA binding protein
MGRENRPPDVTIPDPRVTPTISVTQAARLLGVGKSTAYEAAARGDLPSIRLGRTVRVPTAKLLDLLGLEVGA